MRESPKTGATRSDLFIPRIQTCAFFSFYGRSSGPYPRIKHLQSTKFLSNKPIDKSGYNITCNDIYWILTGYHCFEIFWVSSNLKLNPIPLHWYWSYDIRLTCWSIRYYLNISSLGSGTITSHGWNWTGWTCVKQLSSCASTPVLFSIWNCMWRSECLDLSILVRYLVNINNQQRQYLSAAGAESHLIHCWMVTGENSLPYLIKFILLMRFYS